MRWIPPIFSFIITLFLFYALGVKWNGIPRLAPFFSPTEGFWQNAETQEPSQTLPSALHGLQKKASITFDDRMVPHIFAETEEDLYFLQGYITAKFRLFQMDLVTRNAGGRLSEMIENNPKVVALDQFMRRIGMVYGAENAVKALENDPIAKKVVHAYQDGVNAYIHSLSTSDYPIEYKLLGFQPEEWTVLKTALLLKYMAWDLSKESSDKDLTLIRDKFGSKVIEELFPDVSPKQDPIIPKGTRWDFKPIQPRKAPANNVSLLSDAMAWSKPLYEEPAIEGIGSNNFALGASRTANGNPILANDPHLKLSLPSIWFEIQLSGPGIEVYGASLPGAPGVISGYNKNIAWGVTNVAPDVLDYFKIKFKDAYRKEYFHDGQWKKTSQRIETIKVRNGVDVIDTVIYTHHGPIVLKTGETPFHPQTLPEHAMRWLAHDSSYEMMTFYYLNRATNYDDYVKALSLYSCPAQNFIYADNKKNIALWSNGKYPLKWKEQGKFISDGTDTLYDWTSWVPHDQNPHVKNPQRDFVSSANQFPIDSTYPYYLNFEFSSFTRGKRINDLLAQTHKGTIDSLRIIQNDSKNLLAEWSLPILLKEIDRKDLSSLEMSLLDKLSKWDYNQTSESTEATLFEFWLSELMHVIWDEFEHLRKPNKDITIQLIEKNPNSNWFDIANTEKKENISDNLKIAWQNTVKSLKNEVFKNQDPSTWHWYIYRGLKIEHMAKIDAFSVFPVKQNGGTGIVNATGPVAGPSWRMVVELGEKTKGYGVYPGGQSGNPGSKYYDNMIEKWTNGELYPQYFLDSPQNDTQFKNISLEPQK